MAFLITHRGHNIAFCANWLWELSLPESEAAVPCTPQDSSHDGMRIKHTGKQHLQSKEPRLRNFSWYLNKLIRNQLGTRQFCKQIMLMMLYNKIKCFPFVVRNREREEKKRPGKKSAHEKGNAGKKGGGRSNSLQWIQQRA